MNHRQTAGPAHSKWIRFFTAGADNDFKSCYHYVPPACIPQSKKITFLVVEDMLGLIFTIIMSSPIFHI